MGTDTDMAMGMVPTRKKVEKENTFQTNESDGLSCDGIDGSFFRRELQE